MSSLATLTTQLENLCEEIDSGEELKAELLERFADAKISHAEKLSAYVSVIGLLKSHAAIYSDRAELLKKRSKTCERALDAIKSRLVYLIDATPDLPWTSSDGDKFKSQDNPEKLELNLALENRSYNNIICNFDTIPPKYLEVVTFFRLNKDAVKNDLKAGVSIDFASLEKRGKHLRIY